MRGEAVPKRVAADALREPRQTRALLNCALKPGGMDVVPPLRPSAGDRSKASAPEDPLPRPLFAGTWILRLERVGMEDARDAVLSVLLPKELHARDVTRQRLAKLSGRTVILSFRPFPSRTAIWL